MRQDYIMIGEIVKPQGVRGEVKLRPITSDIERFDGLTDAFFRHGDEYVPVTLSVKRITPEGVYMVVNGAIDRNKAEKQRGEFLYVRREDAIELGDDENLIVELIGLKGIDDEGNELGTITDVLQPGGNDVYVFASTRGEILVPALKKVVLKVDIDAGTMLLSKEVLSQVAVYPDED